MFCTPSVWSQATEELKFIFFFLKPREKHPLGDVLPTSQSLMNWEGTVVAGVFRVKTRALVAPTSKVQPPILIYQLERPIMAKGK